MNHEKMRIFKLTHLLLTFRSLKSSGATPGQRAAHDYSFCCVRSSSRSWGFCNIPLMRRRRTLPGLLSKIMVPNFLVVTVMTDNFIDFLQCRHRLHPSFWAMTCSDLWIYIVKKTDFTEYLPRVCRIQLTVILKHFIFMSHNMVGEQIVIWLK